MTSTSAIEEQQAPAVVNLREQQLEEFKKSDQAISVMKAQYMGLTITDFDDKGMITAVTDAHKQVRDARLQVERTRKQLKADALEWGRQVDGEAKRLKEMLVPIEEHLKGERDKVEAEKKRIKEEKERAAEAKLQDRVERMSAVNGRIEIALFQLLPDDEFDELLKVATEAFETEKIRLEKEEEARRKREKEERLRLKKEEAERRRQEATDRLRQKQEKNERRKREEVDRIERERLAEENRKQQEELERLRRAEAARLEAEEKARLEQEREEREAAELQKQKEEAETRRKRAEELRPEREKIETFATEVRTLSLPGSLTEDRNENIRRILEDAASRIEQIAAGMA